MGIPIFPYKLLSFGISSFYAGIAAVSGRFIRSALRRNRSIGTLRGYIAMVIVGGMGNMAGAVFGAVFITFLNEGLAP
jgi:branched-chain amino acid transport system permease protein